MISICLLTKYENKYLKEWIEHHLKIGIDHFYIYDNNDDLSIETEIAKYCDKKYYTVIPWLSYCINMQTEAYNDCLKKFGADNEWIAFIDTDEFIVCTKDIHELVSKYKKYDYIKIPWVMYNANGQIHYSKKPVMERFTTIVEERHRFWDFKSIVQPDKIQAMNIHDAVEITKDNCTFVDDIKLNHYYTRSLEEWVDKIKRGSCSPLGLRRYDEFFTYNPDLIQYKEQYWCEIQKYNDCIKTIDIKIMAHPSRRNNVLSILKQLNMDESIVVYDDRPNGGDALYTSRKAWLSPMPVDKTHRLVLQDDILLCDNFINIVHDIIRTLPDKVISLFNMVPLELKHSNCCYKKFQTLAG